jgi:hypothetical protein
LREVTAMALLALLLVAIGCFVVDTAFVALFHAHKAGKFEVVRDDEGMFGFATDTGRFNVYPGQRKLGYTVGAQRGTLAFDDIDGIEYRVEERHALLAELFFGFDLTDFMGRYRDTREWFSIAAVARGGQRIPLYLGSRYQRREFLMGWYVDLQSALLSRLGLLKDAETESREACELIRSRLDNPRAL